MAFNKRIFILLIALTATLNGMAQLADSNAVEYTRPLDNHKAKKLNNSLSFGYGIGGEYPYSGQYFTATPSLSLGFENTTFRHIGPGNIGLGGVIAYKQIASGYTDSYTNYNYIQRWNYYLLGAQVVYRITDFPVQNLEPYVGGMAGFYLVDFKFSSTDPNSNEPGDPGYYLTPNHYSNFMAYSLFGGIRSRFNQNGSVWIQAGYGFTSLAFGVSYKI